MKIDFPGVISCLFIFLIWSLCRDFSTKADSFFFSVILTCFFLIWNLPHFSGGFYKNSKTLICQIHLVRKRFKKEMAAVKLNVIPSFYAFCSE